MPIQKLILTKPRGFCAGVDRAIDVVEECLSLFGSPVYVKHEIVHNTHVVEQLKKKGAVTVERVEDIPSGAVAVFSAHGSPPEDFAKAKAKGIRVIDATCPLVTKVHLEVHRFAKEGYSIIYIGHKGHAEGIGVLGELPGQIPIVEDVEQAGHLDIGSPAKLVYLTQTTLSVDETRQIIAALKKRYPQIRDPPAEDICYATTNRQLAIKELAKHTDMILVVGSKTSSNSNRLVETARAQGRNAYLVDDVSGIQPAWLEGITTLGLSSGASAPENVVQEIAEHFTQQGAVVEEIEVLKEHMVFKEPAELMKMKEETATNK